MIDGCKLILLLFYLSLFDFADVRVGQSGVILKFDFLVNDALGESRCNFPRDFILVVSGGGGINKAQPTKFCGQGQKGSVI